MSTELSRWHISPEMLALSAVELVLTFALALIFLTPSPANVSAASVHFALTCALTACFTAFVIGLYRPQMFERAQRLIFSTLLSALISFPAVWLVSKGVGLSDYWPVGYDFLRPIKIIAIWYSAVLGVRLAFLLAARLNLFVYRVGVIGMPDSPSVRSALNAGRKGFLEVSVFKPGTATAPALKAEGIRTLIMNTDDPTLSSSVTLRDFQLHGIAVQPESVFWENCLRRVDVDSSYDRLHDLEKLRDLSEVSQPLARAFDIVVSLILLLATLPIISFVALLIWLDSSGPVLYCQERVGINNLTFTLFKFRSMRSDAEAFGPRWAQERDPRVTRIGLFLRRTRIDELPQLFNILQGEMSFIGPRPERPHFVEQLSAVIPFYHKRTLVKPGLTGWAQVNYPYGASVDDARAKLSYDLYYVKNRTIVLDIIILLATIRVILFQEGSR